MYTTSKHEKNMVFSQGTARNSIFPRKQDDRKYRKVELHSNGLIRYTKKFRHLWAMDNY